MARSNVRNRIGLGFLAVSFAFLVGAVIFARLSEDWSPADPENAQLVARGKLMYDRHCASCHGAKLEGQPNWQEKLATGRMPAPYAEASMVTVG